MSLCAAVVLLGTPVTTFAEDPEPLTYALIYDDDDTKEKITGVTAVDYSAVTTIKIPASVKDIAEGAFDRCTSLETFTVASGDASFSAGAFGELLGKDPNSSEDTILYRLPAAFDTTDADGVVTYTLPSTVTEIKDGAFTNCSKLKTFNLGDSDSALTWDDFSFTGGSRLSYFAGSRGTLSISGTIRFASACGCSLLTAYTDDDQLLRVAPATSGVRNFGSSSSILASPAAAFAGCDALTAALVLCPVSSSGSGADFAGCRGVPLLVPSSTLASLSLGSDPASVLGFEVDPDDRSRLFLTGRTGNTDKALELACDTFGGYTLAIKDGVTIDNLAITHTYGEDNKCTTCGAVEPIVPVTGVTLSETAKSLTVGETFDLTATVSPENASNQNVTWTSSDPSVADVSSDGCITAMGPGTATITVCTVEGGFTAECEVTVQAYNDGDDGGGPVPEPTPPIDRSSWGTPYVREADGVTQYVVEDPASPDYGMTSVELDKSLASAHGAASLTYWVRESSGSTSAWYGLKVHMSACNPGNRFYVQWLSPGDPGYDALFAKLDDAAKERIEDDNGWIFNMGIRDPDGKDLHYITLPSGFSFSPIVYVQIGDDWDADDLNAYYIAAGGDETVPVDYLMLDYPGGTDTFGRMTLSHFSPYIIFDELTDAEKAARNVTTGDLATQLLVSGLAIVLVSSLGVMLKLITSKKKFED